MKWSSLSNRQRAFVSSGASFNRDTVAHGRVTRRGAAKNSKAEASQTLRALDRDDAYARERAAAPSMAAALAQFTESELTLLAVKIPAGRAYGTNELNRRRAGAMPMNYYRGTQYGV